MSPLLPLFLTVLVDVLALTLVLPLFPYLAEHYGATPLVVGALFATFPVCQLLSGPMLGSLSDRIGRKPVLVGSQIGTCIGLLMMAFGDNIFWLFIGRAIDGLTAGNLSVAQAFITDVTTPDKRTRAYGLIGIAFGIGFLFGPAISGLLGRRVGFTAPLVMAAGLSGLSVVLSTTLLPNLPPKHAVRDSRGRIALIGSFLQRPATRTRLLEMFLFGCAFSMLTGGLALFLSRRLNYDVEHVGYVFALSGFVGMGVQGVLGMLVRRHGELRLSAIGFLAMMLGYLLIVPIQGTATLVLAVVVGGFGSAIVRPTMTTLITSSVPDTEHGAVLGVSQSFMGVAQTAAPILAGALIGANALNAWAFAAAGFAGLGLVLRFFAPGKSSPALAAKQASPKTEPTEEKRSSMGA